MQFKIPRRLRQVLAVAVLVSAADAGSALAAATVRLPPALSGTVKVIDGDTLEIAGQRIRLHGIDAPERGQLCRDTKGADYPCGQRATAALAGMVRRQSVRCEPRDVDDYHRLVSVCYVGDSDVNGGLVEAGLALAYRFYSRDYVAAEDEARAARRGLWAGTFEKPWDYRRRTRGKRSAAGQVADGTAGAAASSAACQRGCCIKGNINGRGERIYHRPGQRHYGTTVINPGKGERYFCSPAEAEAAGWRPARQ